MARATIANPPQVQLIAEARVKTDKIDAAVLSQLYASDFLPEVGMPDENMLALRRQDSRRAQLVRQRTRLKNEVHAVLAAHSSGVLLPTCLARRDGFGAARSLCQWMSALESSNACGSCAVLVKICARWIRPWRRSVSVTNDCAGY